MPKASVKRLIDNRKDKLIEFVLDIDKYPEFIPFCKNAKIYERTDERDKINIIADLTIGKGPFPIVKSATISVRSPFCFLSCTFEPLQNGTNSGYFSISKTNSMSLSFLLSINLLTDAFGINEYFFYYF